MVPRRDTYGVEIEPDQDDALILAVRSGSPADVVCSGTTIHGHP